MPISILRCCWPIGDAAIQYFVSDISGDLPRAFHTLAPVSARRLILCQILCDRNGNIYFCQINQFALEAQGNCIVTVAAPSCFFRVWIPVLVDRSCGIRGVWALEPRPPGQSALMFDQILSQLQGGLHNLVRLTLNCII